MRRVDDSKEPVLDVAQAVRWRVKPHRAYLVHAGLPSPPLNDQTPAPKSGLNPLAEVARERALRSSSRVTALVTDDGATVPLGENPVHEISCRSRSKVSDSSVLVATSWKEDCKWLQAYCRPETMLTDGRLATVKVMFLRQVHAHDGEQVMAVADLYTYYE